MKMKYIEEGSPYNEPIGECPVCGPGVPAYAEWVDNGFGPYAVQAGPFHCMDCGWVEVGCPQSECITDRCTSWDYCQGKAISGVAPHDDNPW